MQPKTRIKVVDTLMDLAAERPWDEVGLDLIAERSGVPLNALRAGFDGRLAILAEFVRRIDEKTLAAIDPELGEEAPRERLFDILFSRFEMLGPYKAAIRNLARAARRDPLLALELNRSVTQSMAWMLNAAGIEATGLRGAARAQGLAIVWARVMSVWLGDSDPGQARTMAALDRRLREAERNLIRVERLRRFLGERVGKRRSSSPRAEDNGEVAEGHPS